MNPNLKPSDQVALLAAMSPVSQAATTVVSSYVPMSDCDAILAILETGVLGTSATVDVKLVQAKDASGTSVKDITGKAITQLVKASNDNDQVMLNCRSDELDVNNGFTHVALSVTVGAAASLISAQILGLYGRYQPVDHAASVVEVVD